QTRFAACGCVLRDFEGLIFVKFHFTISWVTKKGSRTWRMWDFLIEIDSLVEVIKEFLFVNVLREANGFADSLAKSGVCRDSLFSTWL
ncbi:hypothetical protein Godav_019114, partial [Gossypium davidsonii]|nr:hypothetical protein [Gossypium davidsonii]MBA0641628.1 hypothetical protein [Gossypium klotzschianum]